MRGMETPKFNVPTPIEKRGGRIILFLGSVAAVSLLLVRFGGDYSRMFCNIQSDLPGITVIALDIVGFVTGSWWAIAAGALVLTLLFIAATKSGTMFTVLSILVWLFGAGVYVSLWLPSRTLAETAGG
jgi:type II secretory pathway component PulF